MSEILAVNFPTKAVYNSLQEYFAVKGDTRVRNSLEPSYLEVEFGSWFSMERGKERGIAKIDILPKNSKSYLKFNFSFAGAYGIIAFIAFTSLLIFWTVIYLATPISEVLTTVWELQSIFIILLVSASALVVILPLVMEGYNVSRTKTKFIEGVRTYLASMKTEKK